MCKLKEVKKGRACPTPKRSHANSGLVLHDSGTIDKPYRISPNTSYLFPMSLVVAITLRILNYKPFHIYRLKSNVYHPATAIGIGGLMHSFYYKAFLMITGNHYYYGLNETTLSKYVMQH